MPEITEQEALNVLRQIRGLRDAFLGFNQIVDRLTPLIELVSQARQSVEQMERLRDDLQREIATLDEQKKTAAEGATREIQRLLDLKEQVDSIAKSLPKR